MMKDEEILKKAIEKAVKNGYVFKRLTVFDGTGVTAKDVYNLLAAMLIKNDGYFKLIFSHDFAKAFWGKKPIHKNCNACTPKWQYHLKEMVLEKEPLKYLEKFL